MPPDLVAKHTALVSSESDEGKQRALPGAEALFATRMPAGTRISSRQLSGKSWGGEDLAEGSGSLMLPQRVQETKSAGIFLDRLLTFSTFTLLCQLLWVLQLSHCSNFLKPSPRGQSHPESDGGRSKSLELYVGIAKTLFKFELSFGRD